MYHFYSLSRWKVTLLLFTMVCLLIPIGNAIYVERATQALQGTWRVVNMTVPQSPKDKLTLTFDKKGYATLTGSGSVWTSEQFYYVIQNPYKVRFGRVDFSRGEIVKMSQGLSYARILESSRVYIHFENLNLITVHYPAVPGKQPKGGWKLGDDISLIENSPAMTCEWRRIR